MTSSDVVKALGTRGVIINVAGGSVVDEQAMISALKSGPILAAGLDVFEKEPNVPDELRTMQNVVLLPHIGSASVATRQSPAPSMCAKPQARLAGRPPATPGPPTPAK